MKKLGNKGAQNELSVLDGFAVDILVSVREFVPLGWEGHGDPVQHGYTLTRQRGRRVKAGNFDSSKDGISADLSVQAIQQYYFLNCEISALEEPRIHKFV